MLPTHFSFARSMVKSCSSMFSATGQVWFESVVALKRFAALARRPCLRRLEATVFASWQWPCSAKWRVILGAP